MSEVTLGWTLSITGLALLESGQRQRAEECFAELKAIAERSRQGNLLLASMNRDAVVATLDGRLDDAIAIGRQIEALGEELGLSTWAVMMELFGVRTALTHFGKFDELARLYDLISWPRDALLLACVRRESEAVAALANLVMAWCLGLWSRNPCKPAASVSFRQGIGSHFSSTSWRGIWNRETRN